MNHHEAADAVAERLLVDGNGWERPLEHQFRHPRADVYVQVYGTSIEVLFGMTGDLRYAKRVAASTTEFPATAVAAVTDVAQALVTAHTLAANQASWQTIVVLGDPPPPDDLQPYPG